MLLTCAMLMCNPSAGPPCFIRYLKGCIGVNWVDADVHHTHHTGAEGAATGIFGEQPHAQSSAARVVAQPHVQEGGGAVITVAEPHAQSKAAKGGGTSHDVMIGSIDDDDAEATLGPAAALSWACGGTSHDVMMGSTDDDDGEATLGPAAALSWACGTSGVGALITVPMESCMGRARTVPTRPHTHTRLYTLQP
jgi:hypothetical protein